MGDGDEAPLAMLLLIEGLLVVMKFPQIAGKRVRLILQSQEKWSRYFEKLSQNLALDLLLVGRSRQRCRLSGLRVGRSTGIYNPAMDPLLSMLQLATREN